MIFRGKKIEVRDILKMWVKKGLETGKEKRFFRVKGKDGFEHKIYLSRGLDGVVLCLQRLRRMKKIIMSTYFPFCS